MWTHLKDALNILLVSSLETSTSSITSESPIQTSQITSKIPLEFSTDQENEKAEDQHTTPSSSSTSSDISKGYTDTTTTNGRKKAEMTSKQFGLNSSPIGTSTIPGEKTTWKTSSIASMVEITAEASTETIDRQLDETSVPTATKGHSAETLGINTFETTPQVLDERGSELQSTQCTETPKSDLSTENLIEEKTFQVFSTADSSRKNSDNTMLTVTSQAAEAQTSEAVSIESYTTKSTETSILNATPERTVDKISQLVTTETVSKHLMDETSQLESIPQTIDVGVTQPVSTDTYSTESVNKPILQETSMSPSEQTSYPGKESHSTKVADVHRFAVTSQATDKKTSQSASIESHSTDSKENLIPETTSVWSMGTISQADTKESSSTEVVTKTTDGEVTRTTSDEITSTTSGMSESATTERLMEKVSQPIIESPSTKVTEQSISEISTQSSKVVTSYPASTESQSTKFNSPMDQTLLPDTTKSNFNTPYRTSKNVLGQTSQEPSIETYSTTSKEKLMTTVTPEPVMEQTAVSELLTNPSTKAVERVMFETSSAELNPFEIVSTEGQSTTSEYEPMFELTTPERLMEEISDATDAADRSATTGLYQTERSQGTSTEGHRILYTEATIPGTTSGSSIDKTMLSMTSSKTTEMATSDTDLTQSYSTKPEHKPFFELTTPENLIDESSQLVTMESSSTKAVESASPASSLETSQPARRESRTTKSDEELPSKVTSGPDNLETSGPSEFTHGVTMNNVHTPEEGNIFLINEQSPQKNLMYTFFSFILNCLALFYDVH